jgi:serine/threonine protein kinase
MKVEYQTFCQVDPTFYDVQNRRQSVKSDFAIASQTLPNGWQRHDGGEWLVFWPENSGVPKQGWKIHLSGCLDNCEKIIAVTWDYCIPRRIAFKFLRNRRTVHMRNNKYASRSGSGKLVTIYPIDEAALESICKALYELLKDEPGPHILSDLRLGNSLVHVRYGGFAMRRCLSPSGEWVPAIEDPTNNKWVPDIRGTVFTTPAWVKLPPFLEPHLARRNATTLKGLPYEIKEALHFSNGGGVYVGYDPSGTKVILKEARPHAGLDFDGIEAVTRLLHEKKMMTQLASSSAVPRVHGVFDVSGHQFLAIEFIEGKSLRDEFKPRYPLLVTDPEPKEVEEYTQWAMEALAQVERVIDELHHQGIVFGDLHWSNILVRPDSSIALIDFETAFESGQVRRSKLGAPGFSAPLDRSGFEIDRYALACIQFSLFLPITQLLTLDHTKAGHFANIIEKQFPIPKHWLKKAVQTVTKKTEHTSNPSENESAPYLYLENDQWTSACQSMGQAILASATPERDDRLFPGDIAQFSTGGLNLAHGAAGVLYALDQAGIGRFPEYENWLLKRATQFDKNSRLGFYDGLHGIAYLLDHLGYQEQAHHIIEITLRESLDRLGDDLQSGLSGIGLSLLFSCTGSFREDAFKILDIVSSRLGAVESVPNTSGGEAPYAGLMRGSSGRALFFILAYEITNDIVLLDHAATAIRQDLRRCAINSKGCMLVNEGWRTMPYLATGSAGIGLVIRRYLTYRHDPEFAAAAVAIRAAAHSRFYVQPALFDGRCGTLLYLNDYHFYEDEIAPEVREQMRCLSWHGLQWNGHLAFPGEQLLRVSMDLATGTAGVL